MKGRIWWRHPGFMPLLDDPRAQPRWFFVLLCKIEDKIGRKIW
jgi:hypothetical protein